MDIYEKAKKSQNKARKDLEEKDKPIYTSFLETEDYFAEQIIEEVPQSQPHLRDFAGHAGLSIDEEKIKFIIYNKSNPEKIESTNQLKINNLTYKPVVNKIVCEGAILLPTQIEEYGTDFDLVGEIKEFLFKNFQPPPFYKAILPYLILFYWVSDRFPFVPYLHFIGLPATGKSTALKVFGSICYKSISGSGAITLASLFRLAHQFKGTILLDEFELGKKGGDEYRQFVQLLRSGVEDTPVYRTEGEGKKEIELYRIKAPRIFSSQTAMRDAALQSRMIEINMHKATIKLPLYRLVSFYNQAQKLRNKLLLWRFRHLDKINLADIEYGIPELQKFDKRVQQVLTPIYYLADPQTRNSILTLIKEQEEETKKERLEEVDGQLYVILKEAWENGQKLSVGDIAISINNFRRNQGYKTILSDREVGSTIRKVMGVMTKKTGHEKTYYPILTPTKIEELDNYYGLSNTSPATPASTADGAKDAGHTEEDAELDPDKIPF